MARVVLCCCGSVATIKITELRNALLAALPPRSQVVVVVTPNAAHFIDRRDSILTSDVAPPKSDIALAGRNPPDPLHGQPRRSPPGGAASATPRLLVRSPTPPSAPKFSIESFIGAYSASDPSAPLRVLTDEHEWALWQRRGDAVLHIELRAWADAVCVAPLSANSLAAMASGLAPNLVLSLLRAWDWGIPPTSLGAVLGTAHAARTTAPCAMPSTESFSDLTALEASHASAIAIPHDLTQARGEFKMTHDQVGLAEGNECTDVGATAAPAMGRHLKPVVIAPAMNTAMWLHPATGAHLAQLRRWATGGSRAQGLLTIVPPVSKLLACGDLGVGAMAAPSSIAMAVAAAVATRRSSRPEVVPTSKL
jgi:hypothetical protein